MGSSHLIFLTSALAACAMGMFPSSFGGTGGLQSFGGGQQSGFMGGSGGMTGFGGAAGRTGMMGRAANAQRLLALRLYDRKRSILKNVISLYEKHGCIDPMQKMNEYVTSMITISGCNDPRANISCRQYGMGQVNFQTMMMQNTMSPARQNMLVNQLQNLSPYNQFKDYILGTVPRGQVNPAAVRMVFGNEGAGSGLAFQGERLDRIKNMRTNLLPFQCQDVKVGSLGMGMCCPGPVSFSPAVEMRAFAGFVHV